MKHSGLGRGLDVLLPQEDHGALNIREISIEDIQPNNEQPRKTFDEESLQSLSESIQNSGVLSPLLVVENGLKYQIVAGERRYRAAKMAGLATVPCIVRELTMEQQLEAALIENLQREDLNPIEEATAIQDLMVHCGYTQEQAAQRLGKSRPAVANALRLLNLPEDIQALVMDGSLSAGHARVLAGIDDAKRQTDLLNECLAQGWSVRQLELEAAGSKSHPQPVPVKAKKSELSVEMKEFAAHLRDTFGMKIQIAGNEKKGKITLSYRTREELEHFYDLIHQLPNE